MRKKEKAEQMKSNTNALKEYITSLLKTACAHVHFEKCSEKSYPYIVYELSETGHEAGRTQYKFEVNCIDKGTATAVDDIADCIQDMFDEGSYDNEKISFYTYRNLRQTVDEEDKNIRRRRLIFELYFYSKEE